MKTITIDEIENLYQKCGLKNNNSFNKRISIKSGLLNNKLNCDFSFLNKKKTILSIQTPNQ